MSHLNKKTVSLIIAVLVVCLVYPLACIKKVDDNSTTGGIDSDTVGKEGYTDSIVIEIAGAESMTVLDVLESNHQVEKKSSVMGVFVTGIDSVENGDGMYWLYSVNGSVGQVACDRFLTRTGDTVCWHFRKITK
ncbi:MAG: hypothetical protein DRP47_00370 [Candidatus Zixiibacteriota bacterium]|nr:MAG: hypothetical protein DRP47_00370 [candidate division Zixibacteria bacterium]